MAKIKYSALVSDMRNKLNGSVLSANRYGSYIRNKVTPVNPQSVHQQGARQILSLLSSGYRNLTPQQIAAWNGSGVNFPFTDIFGDVKHLSGQTLYVKLNANLAKVGQSHISSPPLPEGFPAMAVATATAEVDNSNIFTLDMTITTQTVPVGFSLVVYATKGLSPSIQFVKNRYRFLGAFTASAGVVDLTSIYSGRFGQPLVGEIVHLRAALVNNSTGQQSVPYNANAVVVSVP